MIRLIEINLVYDSNTQNYYIINFVNQVKQKIYQDRLISLKKYIKEVTKNKSILRIIIVFYRNYCINYHLIIELNIERVLLLS